MTICSKFFVRNRDGREKWFQLATSLCWRAFEHLLFFEQFSWSTIRDRWTPPDFHSKQTYKHASGGKWGQLGKYSFFSIEFGDKLLSLNPRFVFRSKLFQFSKIKWKLFCKIRKRTHLLMEFFFVYDMHTEKLWISLHFDTVVMYKKWEWDLATFLTLLESLKEPMLVLAPDVGGRAGTVCEKRPATKCSAGATCPCDRRWMPVAC